MTKLPIITIQGPTAVGKSDIAFQLARRFNTEIISADSRKVYKFLDVGTAKPSKEKLAAVKHHLIDIINPDQQYNAGKFREDAGKISENLIADGKIPIVEGGTGFYIKTLLEGIFEAPDIPAKIRDNLTRVADEKGTRYLHNYLASVDKKATEKIDPNDTHRLIRALEVYEATGKTITSFWKEQQLNEPYKSYEILVEMDRDDLYERINKRVDNMLNRGLLKEIESLFQKGYTKDDQGMNTVGYKEFYDFFEGKCELERCIEKIKQHTRNYAKRQYSWYRKIDFNLTIKNYDINLSKIYATIEKWVSENK